MKFRRESTRESNQKKYVKKENIKSLIEMNDVAYVNLMRYLLAGTVDQRGPSSTFLIPLKKGFVQSLKNEGKAANSAPFLSELGGDQG